MSRTNQSRVRAERFVSGIARRFSDHPNLLWIVDGFVTAEASAYFSVNAREYPACLIEEATGWLTSRDESVGSETTSADVRSWLRWLRHRLDGPPFMSGIALSDRAELPPAIKEAVASLAPQVLREEYFLDRPDGDDVTGYVAHDVLSTNLISATFTPDGRYVCYCGDRKFLLPIPAESWELCSDELLQECRSLMSGLGNAPVVATSRVRALVRDKYRLERAMLDAVLEHAVAPMLSEARRRVLAG